MSSITELFLAWDKNDENASDLTNCEKLYINPQKKKRAARATKAEMSHRKKVVALILKDKGDLTPKDLNPMVDETLGKPRSTSSSSSSSSFDDILKQKSTVCGV